MKYSNAETIGFDQFSTSTEGKSTFGRLLVKLVQESAWSNEYTVYGSFTPGREYLTVTHRAFMPDKPLIIKEDSGVVLTVRGVEEAVREHLRTTHEWTHSFVQFLQARSHASKDAREKINEDKALAAIKTAFPQSPQLSFILTTASTFYAFVDSTNIIYGKVYVTRPAGNDFVGGVVYLNHCTGSGWYNARDGMARGERAWLFFGQLARAFAAEWLAVNEDALKLRGVVGNEQSPAERSLTGEGRFDVEQVTFDRVDDPSMPSIAVTFREDLPTGVQYMS